MYHYLQEIFHQYSIILKVTAKVVNKKFHNWSLNNKNRENSLSRKPTIRHVRRLSLTLAYYKCILTNCCMYDGTATLWEFYVKFTKIYHMNNREVKVVIHQCEYMASCHKRLYPLVVLFFVHYSNGCYVTIGVNTQTSRKKK